jgi:phosphatidylglycerol:prolipoprotein diacylglycerol transferase
MIPVLLHIGPIRIYSFGLMAALAWIAGILLLRSEMRRMKLGAERAETYALAAFFIGFLGARLNYVVIHLDEVRADPWGAILTGSGLVWYGGAVLGFLAVLLLARRWHDPFPRVADAFAPALAAAYMIGRIGCFLSGDGDYGKPTSLPWGMAFPHGIVPTTQRVHPTPIYEILMTLPIFWVLWRTRARPWPSGDHIALYLALAGVERFIVEFWRRNPVTALGLTTPQILSLGAIAAGICILLLRRRQTVVECVRS